MKPFGHPPPWLAQCWCRSRHTGVISHMPWVLAEASSSSTVTSNNYESAHFPMQPFRAGAQSWMRFVGHSPLVLHETFSCVGALFSICITLFTVCSTSLPFSLPVGDRQGWPILNGVWQFVTVYVIRRKGVVKEGRHGCSWRAVFSLHAGVAVLCLWSEWLLGKKWSPSRRLSPWSQQ